MNIERIVSGTAPPPEFELVRGIPGFAAEPIESGVTCLVARDGGRAVARLSLHLRDGLRGAPGRSGLVGHYEASNVDAGAALLRAACDALTAGGAHRVLGPMSGSTWSRYRLALPREPGDPECAPPHFSGEPRNPFDYPDHFNAAGFEVCARYESRIDDLAAGIHDATELARRARDAEVSMRPLDLARFDGELDLLHELSLEAFADNLYYSPIDRAEFRAIYAPQRSRMDADLVTIVTDARGVACGYLFGFADPLAAEVGSSRIVLKTLAVSPRARGRGVAGLMIDALRATAVRRRCRDMVHALMHVDNISSHLSHRYHSGVFRRYALWQWTP